MDLNLALKKYWPDILIAILSLFFCLLAFFNVVIPMDVFAWDQSHHTLYGTWIANDIQAGDWELFWNHTHRQTLWPFLQSWILGIFFIFFGISYVSARASHLIIFFFLLLATWQVGKILDEKRGKLIGGISWGLMVVSPYLWMLGINVMIEVIAALITIYIFYSLLKLTKTNKWIWILPAGILMALMIVVKYNFAMTIYLSVVLWAIYGLISNKGQFLNKSTRTKLTNLFFIKYFLIFLPSILMFFWWMFGANSKNKWAMVWYSRSEWVAKAHQVPGFLDNFIYYFKQLIVAYNEWFPIIGVLILIGFVGSFFLPKRKNSALVMLLFFTWGTMPIHIWVLMNKLPRYIYNIVPLIYILAVMFWLSIWDILKEKLGLQKAKTISILAAALLAIIMIIQSGPMINFFSGKTYKMAPGERYMDALDYIGNKIPPDATIVCGSEMVKLSPYTFDFHFRHHIRNRTAPVYNKFSLPYVKFKRGMYLVAYMEDPTAEKMKNDEWYKFINANKASLKKIDSKFFTKLNLRTDIYLTK
jgi:4-amino-4-deoxy-L-arabinose transferase-like glycosyltransferase